jgi:hypothetical protein
LLRPKLRNRGIVKRGARPAAKGVRVAAERTRSVPQRALPAPKRDHRDIEGELYARRKALADLMHSQVLGQGDVARAFAQITETATEVLEVERASVWRLVDSGEGIECIDLYERSKQRHSKGLRISAADAPRYFEAL